MTSQKLDKTSPSRQIIFSKFVFKKSLLLVWFHIKKYAISCESVWPIFFKYWNPHIYREACTSSSVKYLFSKRYNKFCFLLIILSSNNLKFLMKDIHGFHFSTIGQCQSHRDVFKAHTTLNANGTVLNSVELISS